MDTFCGTNGLSVSCELLLDGSPVGVEDENAADEEECF